MKFALIIAVLTASCGMAHAQTVNNMTLKNQFGEVSTNQIVSVSAAGGAAIGAAIPTANVLAKVLTGYSSSAGTVAASDTILVGFNKLNGNQVLSKATADAALPSASFTAAAVTGKAITGYVSGAGTISAADTILTAINKLNGNASVVVECGASAGGAATEALTCTGLTATDTVLAVTQRVKGANSLPLLGYSTLGTNTITGVWSADPGANAVVRVLIRR